MFRMMQSDITVSLVPGKACVARDMFENGWASKDEFQACFQTFIATSQSYLRTKMATKQSVLASKRDSIKPLVDATNLGISAEGLITMYIYRRDQLIKDLKIMKSKQMTAAHKQA